MHYPLSTMFKSQHSQLHNVTDIGIKAAMAIAFAVLVQGSDAR
ncbi:hypothetical protein NIES4071_105800 (plasmid) [Calothrix sp. NIES-4071]|nr:hypothetical protein NIES4071_105800 [Calothrix sp. NIES-4071]BAZ64998.1 hypothetical protein NIES4105_107310 [Calothrix sp. NIES-4105]